MNYIEIDCRTNERLCKVVRILFSMRQVNWGELDSLIGMVRDDRGHVLLIRNNGHLATSDVASNNAFSLDNLIKEKQNGKNTD